MAKTTKIAPTRTRIKDADFAAKKVTRPQAMAAVKKAIPRKK